MGEGNDEKIVLSMLAVILMMGMTGCSSSTNENSSQKTGVQATEYNLSVDFEKEYGIKNEDMQELLDSIKENMLASFKENNIEPSTYVWPARADENGNSNYYVFKVYLNFCVSDDESTSKYDEKAIEYFQEDNELSTENAKIMQQVGRAFIYWVEKHPEYKNSTIKNNVPWNEIFEKYISFK